MKMELYPCILFKFLGLFFILADNCFFTELSGCLPRVDSFLSEPEITVGWPLLEPFRVPLPLLPASQLDQREVLGMGSRLYLGLGQVPS